MASESVKPYAEKMEGALRSLARELGSVRAGRANNEYESSDLRGPDGGHVEYEISTPYYGAHVGLGYVWNVTDKAALDLYGKYLWTRQAGGDDRLPLGEKLSFESADSHRLRLGSRLSYQVNDCLAPYAGAAWEYEFDAEARASANGHPIDAPNLKGSTGIGEIGLNLTPSQSLPLSFDLGIMGYVGKREGVSGSLQIKWEF